MDTTLRDQFAVAALTGFLMNGDFSVETIPGLAYDMADAMLRKRNAGVSTLSPNETDAEEAIRLFNAEIQYLKDDRDKYLQQAQQCYEYAKALETQKPKKAKLTLTDEEREAIAHAASRMRGVKFADTLRKLLERTGDKKC